MLTLSSCAAAAMTGRPPRPAYLQAMLTETRPPETAPPPETTETPPETAAAAPVTAKPLPEPVTLSFSGKPLSGLFYDTRKREAYGGYAYEYPVGSGDITVLGANLVYVGESFAYDCVFTTTSPVPAIEWSTDSPCGSISPDGVFTAVSAGICTVTASCEPDGISSSLRVHCVCPGDGIDFIPMVNNIPISNKTYPLPSDYAPRAIPEAKAAAERMIAAAEEDGLTLTPMSFFRSFDYQKDVYELWRTQYGDEQTDLVSARPGFSEHQLGLALDFNLLLYGFADTKEGKWLKAHCSEYGFILRYPSFEAQEYTGYSFEPWHVRYMGEELAARVTETGKSLEELLGIDSRYR